MIENQLISSLREQAFFGDAIAYATDRNPALLDIDSGSVSALAKRAALEMAHFEELARTQVLRTPQTADEAKRIKAIWDLSGVGTYLKEFQDDRWKGISWAGWTDRRRTNYSVALTRRLTEVITGKSYKVPLGQKLTSAQLEEVRADIGEYGPHLIYGSTYEQNSDLEQALDGPEAIVPKNKVHIIEDKPVGVNTIDQMKSFCMPGGLEINEGDIIALVAHAPHVVRALHLLNRYKPLPEGMILQPHPLPSPPSAGTNYPRQEISGILYYTFITGDSTEDSHSYQI